MDLSPTESRGTPVVQGNVESTNRSGNVDESRVRDATTWIPEREPVPAESRGVVRTESGHVSEVHTALDGFLVGERLRVPATEKHFFSENEKNTQRGNLEIRGRQRDSKEVHEGQDISRKEEWTKW